MHNILMMVDYKGVMIVTLSNNSNAFDSIEVENALNEHQNAWWAYRRMANHETRATAEGNKWGCAEQVRYQRSVAVLLQLGHTKAEITAIEEAVS